MYKFGFVREDGWVFRGYRKGAKGLLEHWISPEAWVKRKAHTAAHDKARKADKRSTAEGLVADKAYFAEYARKARRKNPEAHMLARVKNRAKKKGLAFNLSREDVSIPEACPVLGLPLLIGEGVATDSSPELDRIDNTKGYVKGNVMVISRRANRVKNDATPEELMRIASFYLALLRPAT